MRNGYVNYMHNRSKNILYIGLLLFVFISSFCQSNSYAAKFSMYDKVEVYDTGSSGLNLRSWYGTSYSVNTIMADGTQMTVYGGPYEADGYTWWYLYGYVNSIYSSTGYYYSAGYYYGYAVEDYLQKVSTSCTYSLSSSSKSVGSSGGSSYSVSVTTSSGCSWTATSNASWITITSGSSGSGNGTVYYSVSSNSSTSSRTGTMTIAGNTFTVTQDGQTVTCSYSISPTSQSFSASGGSGSVSVTTSSGCSWTATSNASWITITSGSSVSGNGTVNYSVSSNSSTSSRTGTMTIAGQTFTVTQSASYSPPTVTTGTYQTVSSSSVQLFGTVNPNGLSTTGWFEWGTTASYGNKTTEESLGSGTSVVQMLHEISGLSASTIYYFRAVGKNSSGTSYGDGMSFTTEAPAATKPAVTTSEATSVTSTTAMLNGTVNPNGAATTGWFEWGTTSSYGNTTQASSGGSGTIDVTMSWSISGLSPSTTYHFRAVGQNSAGTTYGNDKSFTTATGESLQSDLVIQNLSVNPTSGDAGSSATVSFKIYNQGSGSASSSTTNIRISSSSGDVYASDTLLASISTPSISSGGSSSVSQTVTIPSSLSSGTYYIWVILDANSTANQSEENNDKSYTSFTVTSSTSSKSDLVIQNLSVSPTSGNAGSSATVSFKIYNQGSGSASSSTTNIRISSSSSGVYASDTLLASISTPSISSGGSSSVSQTVTIPSSLSSGTYYIWVILDANSTANQSEENNDKSYTSFTVTSSTSSKSDLVIEELSVSPTSGEAGTEATVYFTIRNQGDGDADSSTANIRINTSSSKVSTSNTLLKSVDIPEIPAGGTHSDNKSVTIPDDSKEATHYIWMLLDVNITANQSDVNNDKDYTEFVVTTKKATPTPTPTPSDENLLEKYAPILYMHEEEKYYPTSVETMLDNSELWMIRGDFPVHRLVDSSPTLDTLEGLIDKAEENSNTYYLKLKEGWNEDKAKYYWREFEPVVYGRKTTDFNSAGKKIVILQYWFFYIYNDWDDIHEGDWEMIQINLDDTDIPSDIIFSYHHGGEKLSWDEIEEEDNHPKVFVTLGGHGNWSKKGDNVWHQKIGYAGFGVCVECVDKTSDAGEKLYPKEISNSSGKNYNLIDITNADEEDSEYHWIYWKGFWGKQTTVFAMDDDKFLEFEMSGPPSPPYIDYICEYVGGCPRWDDPYYWSIDPEPFKYKVCSSDNSKVNVYKLQEIPTSGFEYCKSKNNKTNHTYIIYSKEDLQFEVYSLDGEEVTLKISRYNRDTKEVHEVEFDWLEIPKNGKAMLTFSPKKNPDFEIMVDRDLDGSFDEYRYPDYLNAQ